MSYRGCTDLRKGAGVFCAIAVMCSISGVVPWLAAALGVVDPQHDVLVSSSRGCIEVRFHHETDVHARDSGWEVALAGKTRHSDGDHVIHFASGDANLVQWANAHSRGIDVQSLPLLQCALIKPAVAEISIGASRPPPSLSSATLRLLRTTSLVI